MKKLYNTLYILLLLLFMQNLCFANSPIAKNIFKHSLDKIAYVKPSNNVYEPTKNIIPVSNMDNSVARLVNEDFTLDQDIDFASKKQLRPKADILDGYKVDDRPDCVKKVVQPKLQKKKIKRVEAAKDDFENFDIDKVDDVKDYTKKEMQKRKIATSKKKERVSFFSFLRKNRASKIAKVESNDIEDNVDVSLSSDFINKEKNDVLNVESNVQKISDNEVIETVPEKQDFEDIDKILPKVEYTETVANNELPLENNITELTNQNFEKNEDIDFSNDVVQKVKPVKVAKVKQERVKSVKVAKVKPERVKPVKIAKVKQERVKPAKVAKVKPERVKPVKIAKVKQEKVKPVKVAKVKQEKVKPVNVAKVKPERVKPVKVVKVKQKKVKPVKVAKVKPERVKPVKVVKVKQEKVKPVKVAKVKQEKIKSAKVAKVKPERVKPVKVAKVKQEKVKPVKVAKVKPERVKPVKVAKVKQERIKPVKVVRVKQEKIKPVDYCGENVDIIRNTIPQEIPVYSSFEMLQGRLPLTRSNYLTE